jgi:hypothetical protein
VNYLTVLNQTVDANLKSGRVGTPVFVRWTASIAQSNDLLKTQLAEMATYTGRWLSADLCRLYATGTESQGHLALALEYVSGSSALLALTLAHNRPSIALAIYGTHGALYHNEFIVPIRDGSLSPLQTSRNAESGFDQEPPLILAAIEQSLARLQPIEVARSGDRS